MLEAYRKAAAEREALGIPVGLSFFGYISIIHKYNSICNCSCKLHFMCYNNHSHSISCKLKHYI